MGSFEDRVKAAPPRGRRRSGNPHVMLKGPLSRLTHRPIVRSGPLRLAARSPDFDALRG